MAEKDHIHDCITDKRITFLPLVAITANRVQFKKMWRSPQTLYGVQYGDRLTPDGSFQVDAIFLQVSTTSRTLLLSKYSPRRFLSLLQIPSESWTDTVITYVRSLNGNCDCHKVVLQQLPYALQPIPHRCLRGSCIKNGMLRRSAGSVSYTES